MASSASEPAAAGGSAAGNTVVVKPAEPTPLTAIRLAEPALDAGLPEGVLTGLPGRGEVVGERLVAHPAVRKICGGVKQSGPGRELGPDAPLGFTDVKNVFISSGE